MSVILQIKHLLCFRVQFTFTPLLYIWMDVFVHLSRLCYNPKNYCMEHFANTISTCNNTRHTRHIYYSITTNGSLYLALASNDKPDQDLLLLCPFACSYLSVLLASSLSPTSAMKSDHLALFTKMSCQKASHTFPLRLFNQHLCNFTFSMENLDATMYKYSMNNLYT